MRTLAAPLETALNAGHEPYLQLQYALNSGWTWHDAPYSIIEYKMGGLELNVKSYGSALFDAYAIRIKRGAYTNHVAYYETSSLYYVNSKYISEKDMVVIEASILPKGNYTRYSVNGNQTYKQIIDAICSNYGYTATYENPGAAYWSNIFYPAGRTLVMQSPHYIFTLLRQKMFIYALDDNDNEIYFRQWLDDSLVGTGGHPSLETLTTFDYIEQYSLQYRTLMWRDENMTLHYYPDPVFFPNLPYFNLGYLESGASTPTCYQSWHLNEDKRSFHLKYQDGDIICCSSGTYQIKVYEIFNRKHSPSLYLQFIALPKFTTTEAGPLPSTIEAAAPYTPLNTSFFNKNLNSSQNNLQAFAEKVDELDCGPAIFADTNKPSPDDADLFPLVDSLTATHLVRNISWADINSHLDYRDLDHHPAGATDTNDIYRPANSPGGPPNWTGQISSVAGTSVVYKNPTGTEAALVPYSTSLLGKMRLYNLTRGDYALIANAVVATKTITLIANAPAGWAVNDNLTMASQTVSDGFYFWVDIELTSGGPKDKKYLFVTKLITSTVVGDYIRIHPFETFAASKVDMLQSQVASLTINTLSLYHLVSNVVVFNWIGTPINVLLRYWGYLE